MSQSMRLDKQDFLLKSSRQTASEEILIGKTVEEAQGIAWAFSRRNRGLTVQLVERHSGVEVPYKLLEVAA